MVASVQTQADLVEREIFRLVRVELQSPEDVAARMQMDVGEVRRTVARVTDALVAAAPVESEAERQRRIQLSEQVAAAQLVLLIREAHRAFERSRGEQKTVQQEGNGTPITRRRVSQGDMRYLNTAAKIAAMLAKLPMGDCWEASAMKTVVSAAPPATPLISSSPEQPTAENHPDGACSTPVQEQPVTSNVLPITGDVKSTEEFLSELFARARKQHNHANERSVQEPVFAGSDKAPTKPKPR
jgi:hypothetical protein